jgi:ribonuclease III
LKGLKYRLGLPDFVTFVNLKRALTHASLESEQHYQRLEFLGDAILRMLIIDYLLRQYPKIIDKAFLSPCVDELVSAQTQIKIAKKLGLKQSIFSAAPITDSMLSDVLEALIAAVYIDGQDRAVSIIINWFKPAIRERFGEDDLRDSRKDRSDHLPSLVTGAIVPRTSSSIGTQVRSYSEVVATGQQTMKRQKTLLWSASKKKQRIFQD